MENLLSSLFFALRSSEVFVEPLVDLVLPPGLEGGDGGLRDGLLVHRGLAWSSAVAAGVSFLHVRPPSRLWEEKGELRVGGGALRKGYK